MTDKEIPKVYCNRKLCPTALVIINRQQAEIDDARIGVKSYKGKYESAVKTARELQTLVDEQQAEIERLTINMNALLWTCYIRNTRPCKRNGG